MTIYLVDFENVRSEGLKGVQNLKNNDKVVIFYSKNADAITFDVHLLLSKSNAEIETYRILRGGHNSLDFQLSTYLGYLVMENLYDEIVIVSKDKGFLCVTNFWNENKEKCNVEIKICKSIGEAKLNIQLEDEFEDGQSGSFIEKIENSTKQVHKEEIQKELEDSIKDLEFRNKHIVTSGSDCELTKCEKKTNRSTLPKKTTYNTKVYAKSIPCQITGKVSKSIKSKKTSESLPAIQNPQNPISKKKIFSAEVKLNISDDVKQIISGKYNNDIVPVLVETIGKSTGKQHFYRMIVSKMGQKDGLELYKLIKGQYVNLKRK